MQELKPQIDKIRAELKDNQQKMNEEIMALYKKHKVNPVGGCLPMLIQLPVFIGFFRTIPLMIEVRHQSFLWIKDLSQPDTLFKLGFTVPLVGWDTFNLLPIIMTVATIIQQKLSPMGGGNDSQTKNMMLIMPIVFLFILWNMPSGLTLYWTTQNIASILYVLFSNLYKNKIKKQTA
jgi:YidC/Oxa1 family membrane protein insertase